MMYETNAIFGSLSKVGKLSYLVWELKLEGCYFPFIQFENIYLPD